MQNRLVIQALKEMLIPPHWFTHSLPSPPHWEGLDGWKAKVESQEIPAVTGKFGLGVQNEAGQRLTEFCQENALVMANTLVQQHKRRLHMDITRRSILKSD